RSAIPVSPPFFLSLLARPPISTLFPYTTLFRSFVETAAIAIDRLRDLPAWRPAAIRLHAVPEEGVVPHLGSVVEHARLRGVLVADRKSTRLNSSHDQISYAVFCLKKKKQNSVLA